MSLCLFHHLSFLFPFRPLLFSTFSAISRITSLSTLCSFSNVVSNNNKMLIIEWVDMWSQCQAVNLQLALFPPRQYPGGIPKNFGYRCAARNSNYHPIAKPQANQIWYPYSNQIFCFTLRSINFINKLYTNTSVFCLFVCLFVFLFLFL